MSEQSINMLVAELNRFKLGVRTAAKKFKAICVCPDAKECDVYRDSPVDEEKCLQCWENSLMLEEK